MTDPVIVLPDAEAAVIAYLTAAGTTVQVGERMPVDHDGEREFVWVRRIGGLPISRAVDRPNLDILVWAAKHQRRMTIAREAYAQLHAASGAVVETFAGRVAIGGCRDVLGPRRAPDPLNPSAEIVMFTVQLAMTTALPDQPVDPPGYGEGPYGQGAYGR